MKHLKIKEIYIKVDDEDFEHIQPFTWIYTGTSIFRWKRIDITINGIFIKKKVIGVMLANEILQEFSSTVDHIDRDILNNLKSNLRLCDRSQNAWNRSKQRSYISSKYKGVSWHSKHKKWQSRLTYRGEVYSLGHHLNEIDAAIAYDKKAVELFGEFAVLNFPIEVIK